MAPDMKVNALCTTKAQGVAVGGAFLYDSKSRHIFEVKENGALSLNTWDFVRVSDNNDVPHNAITTAVSVNYFMTETESGVVLEAETSYTVEKILC